MVAACLADDDLGDGDLEDEDDPDLLNELAELEKTGQDDEQGPETGAGLHDGEQDVEHQDHKADRQPQYVQLAP